MKTDDINLNTSTTSISIRNDCENKKCVERQKRLNDSRKLQKDILGSMSVMQNDMDDYKKQLQEKVEETRRLNKIIDKQTEKLNQQCMRSKEVDKLRDNLDNVIKIQDEKMKSINTLYDRANKEISTYNVKIKHLKDHNKILVKKNKELGLILDNYNSNYTKRTNRNFYQYIHSQSTAKQGRVFMKEKSKCSLCSARKIFKFLIC